MGIFSKEGDQVAEIKTDNPAERKSLGSGNSSSRCFQVQARARAGYPSFALGREIFDQEWRNVHLRPALLPVGVATPRRGLENLDYGTDFAQAEAHRLAFICAVETMFPGHTVETRIMENYVERTWKATEVGVVTKWPKWSEDHNIWQTQERSPAE